MVDFEILLRVFVRAGFAACFYTCAVIVFQNTLRVFLCAALFKNDLTERPSL